MIFELYDLENDNYSCKSKITIKGNEYVSMSNICKNSYSARVSSKNNLMNLICEKEFTVFDNMLVCIDLESIELENIEILSSIKNLSCKVFSGQYYNLKNYKNIEFFPIDNSNATNILMAMYISSYISSSENNTPLALVCISYDQQFCSNIFDCVRSIPSNVFSSCISYPSITDFLK